MKLNKILVRAVVKQGNETWTWDDKDQKKWKPKNEKLRQNTEICVKLKVCKTFDGNMTYTFQAQGIRNMLTFSDSFLISKTLQMANFNTFFLSFHFFSFPLSFLVRFWSFSYSLFLLIHIVSLLLPVLHFLLSLIPHFSFSFTLPPSSFPLPSYLPFPPPPPAFSFTALFLSFSYCTPFPPTNAP